MFNIVACHRIGLQALRWHLSYPALLLSKLLFVTTIQIKMCPLSTDGAVLICIILEKISVHICHVRCLSVNLPCFVLVNYIFTHT